MNLARNLDSDGATGILSRAFSYSFITMYVFSNGKEWQYLPFLWAIF